MIQLFLLTCLSIQLLSGAVPPAGTEQKNNEKILPLYPIQLDIAFDKPKEAFEEVFNLIMKQYYSNDIDEKSLYWAAIRGMLQHISPPEAPQTAMLLSPDEFEKITAVYKGVEDTIGIKSTYQPTEGSVTVQEVLPGGPSVGKLLPFDRIMRINGRELKGLLLQDVDRLLSGKSGTKIKLKVVRDLQIKDIAIRITSVRTVNVEVHELPDGVIWVPLTMFSEGIAQEFREKIGAIIAKKTGQASRGIIVDLRNNSGGILKEGLQLAEFFIPKNQIMTRIVARGVVVHDIVSTNSTPVGLPLVVLLNRNSASSSEVVGSALRDTVGALLIGNSSQGKATSENTFSLINNFKVRFTVNALYSPLGFSWFRRGLFPDFPVEQDPAALEGMKKLSDVERLKMDAPLLMAYRLLIKEETKK